MLSLIYKILNKLAAGWEEIIEELKVSSKKTHHR